MRNQSKFGSTREFFSSLSALFGGLLTYDIALSHSGQENDFLAENWGAPVAILLVLMFGVGWWVEYRIEDLVVFKGGKIAVRVLVILGLIWFLILVGAFLFIPNDFLQHAIEAGALMSLSGFFLRQSVAPPELK